MFKNNFVVSVKHNGSFLRDCDNIVTIPFGKDYSIYLKNLNSRKAVVKVSVDGKDALGGSSIIVNPDRPLELEGFLEGMVIRNKFRFIQKTKEISDYRGDFIDDGIIRIEYTFEKAVYNSNIIYANSHYYSYPPVYLGSSRTSHFIGAVTTNNSSWGVSNTFSNLDSNISPTCYSASIPQKDEGITVKGGKTNQNFECGFTNELEEVSSVITLKLCGDKNGTKVEAPMFVNARLTCPTCGKKSKTNCKFCSKCGTFLLLKN